MFYPATPADPAAELTTCGADSRDLPEHLAQWLHDKLVGIVRRAGRHGLPSNLTVSQGTPFLVWTFTGTAAGPYRAAETWQPGSAPIPRMRWLVDPRGGACEGCAEAQAAGAGGCPVHAEPGLWATVTIGGGLPTLGGEWTLCGALDWSGPEVMVRTAPGQTIPRAFYASGAKPTCEHCDTLRARHTCYILRNAEGEHRQIGGSCLSEFVRTDNAAGYADVLVNMYAALDGAAGAEDEDQARYRGNARGSLVSWLTIVCACVRVMGGYVSKAKAADSGRTHTGQIAQIMNTGTTRERAAITRAYGEIKPTAEDVALTMRAIAWAAERFPRDSECSEFEHNLGAVARLGYVEDSTRGTAGYLGEAYKRSLADASTSSSLDARHLAAEVGKRVEFDAEVVRVSSRELVAASSARRRHADEDDGCGGHGRIVLG